MRTALSRLIWLLLGGLAVLAACEGVLRLLPVSMGLYRTPQFERWPLQNFEAHLPYAYSTTWAMLNAHRGTTNNYGHIAPFDYRRDSRPLLVIGDSYVESLMNDYADTLQGQLGRRLGAPGAVYGLGVSGLSASDYLALSRLARDEFRPAAAVFLITDGDLAESLSPRLGNYYLASDGGALRLRYLPMQGESLQKKLRKAVGDSALYRYLQANLHFSLDGLFKSSAAHAAQPAAGSRAVQDGDLQRRVADWFLAELPGGLGLPPQCIVLLVDTDRYAIYSHAAAAPPKDLPASRQYLIEQARRLGFGVSDLDPVFRERYARDGLKFDYWPLDRHWNRLGHAVGADEAYRLLFPDGATRCRPGAADGGPNAARSGAQSGARDGA